MPSQTLTVTDGSGGFALGGTIQAVLNDASDATFVGNGQSYSSGWLNLNWSTFTIPADSVIKSLTLNTRAAKQPGNEDDWSYYDFYKQGAYFGQVAHWCTATITDNVLPFAVTISQVDLDSLHIEVRSELGGVSSIHENRHYKMSVDVLYATAPSVTVTAPSDPASTLTPTVVWTYTQGTDGGVQTAYQVKAFNASQYTAGGFDPSTSSSDYDSGVIASSGTSVATTTLSNTTAYRAYVRVAQTINGAYQWSSWQYKAFFTYALPAGTIIPTPSTVDITSVGALLTVNQTGVRDSPLFDLTSSRNSDKSTISWEVVLNSGTFSVWTSVDNGLTYQQAINGGRVPGLAELAGTSEFPTYLRVRQVFGGSAPFAVLTSLTLSTGEDLLIESVDVRWSYMNPDLFNPTIEKSAVRRTGAVTVRGEIPNWFDAYSFYFEPIIEIGTDLPYVVESDETDIAASGTFAVQFSEDVFVGDVIVIELSAIFSGGTFTASTPAGFTSMGAQTAVGGYVVGGLATILSDDFTALTNWSGGSTVAGRSGNGMLISGSSDSEYTIPAGPLRTAGQTATFSWRTSEIGAAARTVCQIISGLSTNQLTFQINTAGAIVVLRGGTVGTVLGTSASGLIVANTWYTFELSYHIADSPDGQVTVKLNGTTVLTITAADTFASGSTLLDLFRFNGPGAAQTSIVDDFVLTNNDPFAVVPHTLYHQIWMVKVTQEIASASTVIAGTSSYKYGKLRSYVVRNSATVALLSASVSAQSEELALPYVDPGNFAMHSVAIGFGVNIFAGKNDPLVLREFGSSSFWEQESILIGNQGLTSNMFMVGPRTVSAQLNYRGVWNPATMWASPPVSADGDWWYQDVDHPGTASFRGARIYWDGTVHVLVNPAVDPWEMLLPTVEALPSVFPHHSPGTVSRRSSRVGEAVIGKAQVWTGPYVDLGQWSRISLIFTPARASSIEFSLGQLYNTLPVISDDGVLITTSFQVADKCHILATREIAEAREYSPDTDVRTVLIDVVENELEDTHHAFAALPVGALTTSQGFVFEANDVWATVLNTLLENVGYGPVWTTYDGIYMTEPAANEADRGVEWRYVQGSPMVTAASVESVLQEVPNLIRFLAANGPSLVEEGNGLISLVNQSEGPASIDARGVVVPLTLTYQVEDQAALERIAASEAQRIFGGGGIRLSIQVALNPLHDDRDVVQVVKPRVGLPDILSYVVSEWSLHLGTVQSEDSVLMELKLNQLVGVPREGRAGVLGDFMLGVDWLSM